jgi:hypothetical protein
MSNIEYNPSLNDKVNGQLGDLNVGIQIPLSSIKTLFDETPPVPPVPEAPYKVYTALVSQSGGDDPQGITSGLLTIGATYEIIDNAGSGWDFTNVGAPNNNIGTYFVATGTTPNSWGTNEGGDFGTLQYNVGAPTVKVLENTIGNIWFNYEDVGSYGCQSNDLFTTDKTFILATPTSDSSAVSITVTNQSTSVKYIAPLNNELQPFNSGLINTPIEIRVYN